MARELDPADVARLGAPEVKSYLLGKGWERRPSKIADVGIFRNPAVPGSEILLPLSLDFADVHEALARAVESLARVEGRAAHDVLRDLLAPRSDVLRFGVEGAATADGAIGLDEGIALLAGSKKALLAAACSVRRPQRYHPRMSLREAESFVRACRLGQTERGSFVATIECGLDGDDAAPDDRTAGDVADAPFGRRATVLLVRSFARLVDAILADDLSAVVSPPQGAPVVSANLCEAVLEMIPSQDGGALRLTPSWSPFAPPPAGVPARVRIESQYRRPLEEVARSLRPATSAPPELFVGKVDALLGEPADDGAMQGEIVLAAQVEDAVLKVRVRLAPAEYLLAGRAHLESRFVRVRGVLHRGPRVHRLEAASELAVLGD